MSGAAFGPAGAQVVVEERMTGEELSVFALTDGENVVAMLPAQDHKRVGEGETGPNTGGMGAYAPVSLATPELMARVEAEILRPTVAAMKAEGHPFRGLLYAGLMLTPDGPKVVEFNCRFGDPETQVVLPLLRSSLLEPMLAIARGGVHRGHAAGVAPRRGRHHRAGLRRLPRRLRDGPPHPHPRATWRRTEDVIVFHAGTERAEDGALRHLRRPRAGRHRAGADGRGGGGAQPGGGGAHRVRGTALPPRHRLARGGADGGGACLSFPRSRPSSATWRACFPARRSSGWRSPRPDLIEGDTPEGFATKIKGKKIRGVVRRAKNIVMDLGGGRLLVNLGMTGRLLVARAGDEEPTHLGVRLSLDRGRELRYHDVRRFGRLWTMTEAEWRAWDGELGVEPLSDDFSGGAGWCRPRRGRGWRSRPG